MADNFFTTVPTIGMQGLINSKTTSVSSEETSGVPVLGVDPAIETEKRIDNSVPVSQEGSIPITPYGWDSIGDLAKDSFRISPFGMLYRQSDATSGHLWESYKPSSSEFDEIYKAVGVDSDVLDVVLRGARNMDDVRKNITLYKENKYIEKRLAASPWYWQLFGAIVGSSGNPVDLTVNAASFLIPGVGVARGLSFAKGAVARVGTNVVTGVTANQVAGEINGLETDMWRDVAGITITSAGFEALGYGALKIRTGRIKAAMTHDKLLNGETPKSMEEVAPNIAKVSKSKEFITKANDLREQLTSGLPSIDVKHRVIEFRDSNVESVNKLMGDMFHLEEGFRETIGETGVAKQYVNEPRVSLKLDTIPFDRDNKAGTTRYGSGRTTYFEEVDKLDVDNKRYLYTIPNESSVIKKKYGEETYKNYILRKCDGDDIPDYLSDMDKDPLVQAHVKKYIDFYKKRGAQLVDVDAIDNIYSFSNYHPVRIDKDLMLEMNIRLGGAKESIKYLTRYLYDGVFDSPERVKMFRQIYDEEQAAKALTRSGKTKEPKPTKEQEDAAFNAYVWDEAVKAAKGYVDQNNSQKLHPDNYSDFIGKFSFTKRRQPWRHGYVDSNGFSLNSLRADPIDTVQRYANRSRGLVASKRVFGVDFDDFEELLNKAGNDLMDKHFGDAKVKDAFTRDMEALYKKGFGMSVTNQNSYSIGDALGTMLRNGMFSTVGTYMGALTYGELGSLVSSYGATTFARTLPVVGRILDKFAKSGHLDKESIQMVNTYLVGKEMNARLGFTEAMRQAKRRFEGVNPYLAKAVGVTDWLSDHSLAGLIFRYVQERCNDVITDSVTSEIITRALNPSVKGIGGMFKDKSAFERIGITNKDLTYIRRGLKKAVIKNPDGSYSLDEKVMASLSDDDLFRDIYGRLHTYAWEECMQRRNLDDVFTYQLANKNFLFELAMQFKAFAIQSYNKRFVKMMQRMEEGDYLGVFNYVMMTTALSGIVNLLVSDARSVGMDEEARNDYLDRTTGFHDFKDLKNPEVLSQALFYNTINRNPLLASLALGWNTFGIGTGGKTTADILSAEEYNEFVPSFNLGKTFTDMIPSARLLQSGVNLGVGSINYALENPDISTLSDRKRIQKDLMQGLNLLPQVPGLTPIIRDHVKDDLEEYKYGY